VVPLKIALVSSFYFPITGGPSTDMFNLAKTFTELGQDVTVFTPLYSQSLSQDNDHFEVIRLADTNSLRSKISYFLRNPTLYGLINAKIRNDFYSELSKFLKKSEYSVVHCRGIWCPALETNSNKKVTKVMTFGTMPTNRTNYIYKKLIELSLSKVDYKVAVWEGLREPLFKLQGIKVDKVIENGVDVDFFSPNQKKKQGYFTIGTALKFAYKRKVDGLNVLIQAFSKLSYRHKNIRLKIVGDGPLKGVVEETINGLNSTTKQNICLLGELNYFDMPNFYNSLDLYAHISFQDAVPNTLLEAMSCCLPVMANNVGIVPKLVDEETGWIVSPTVDEVYQQLATIIDSDKQTFRDKGEKARKRVKNNFSWKKTALEYLKLYGEG
jgi:phosphatidylinositol alpha-mannosyltransferase